MKFGWVDPREVVDVLENRPGFQHVIITGRDAPQELLEIANLVSEVSKVKHPFDEGYRGQKGIEW
jgi:cob(I)alamin adenosyltransferase